MVSATAYTPSELLLRKDPLVAQHQEDGRNAFVALMLTVGADAFGAQLVEYLRAYIAIDRAIVAVVSPGDGGVLFQNVGDARQADFYIRYVRHYRLVAETGDERLQVALAPPPPDPMSAAFSAEIRATMGMEEELGIAIAIDSDRTALLLLGKPTWLENETELALRCGSFLRPAILAHMRARTPVELPGGSDRRMQQVRSVIGEERLTGRECDIAMLILAGKSTSDIAQKLSISAATVKVHRRHIYGKLNISCQAELFALAFRNMSF